MRAAAVEHPGPWTVEDVPGAPVVVAGELAGRAHTGRTRAKAGAVLALDMPFPPRAGPRGAAPATPVARPA